MSSLHSITLSTRDGLAAMCLPFLKSNWLETKRRVLLRRDASYWKDSSASAPSTSTWSSPKNSKFSLARQVRSLSKWKDCQNNRQAWFWRSTAPTSPRFRMTSRTKWLRTANASTFSKTSWPSAKCRMLPTVTPWSILLGSIRPTLNTTRTFTAYWWPTKTQQSSISPKTKWGSAVLPTLKLATSKSVCRQLFKPLKIHSWRLHFGSRVRCSTSRVWLTQWKAVRWWWSDSLRLRVRSARTWRSSRSWTLERLPYARSSSQRMERRGISWTCRPRSSRRTWTSRSTASWWISSLCTRDTSRSKSSRRTRYTSTSRCCTWCRSDRFRTLDCSLSWAIKYWSYKRSELEL